MYSIGLDYSHKSDCFIKFTLNLMISCSVGKLGTLRADLVYFRWRIFLSKVRIYNLYSNY